MKFKTLALAAAFALLCPAVFAQKDLVPSITWENICANPAPLPVIGQLKLEKSSLDRPSWWSVGCETMDRDYAHFEKYSQYVGLTGAGYARLQSGWAKTEQKKGKYDFAWLDAHVDGLLEQGLHPWMCLCYGNPLYSEHGLDLNAKLFPDGPVMDAWLKYVKAVVKHYKGKITMYEVWNEPDNKRALDSYELYANLFVRTAQAIREVDKDVKIALLASCSPDREYIMQAVERIAAVDGMKYADYLTYHAYWAIPENTVPYVLELKEKLAACSPHTKLLQGETGCPAILEFGHALHSLEWSEYSQAKWDLRSMLTHWGLGCPHSVFTMTDLNYGWMVQSFGLIRTNLKGEPVYLRPKFHAVQHVTSLITADINPTSAVTVESSCGHRIHSVGLEKDGKPVGCALWFSDRRPMSGLERELCAVEIKGLDIKSDKAVYVDLLTGKVHKFQESSRPRGFFQSNTLYFDKLPMWDSPVVIMDRDYVPMSE